MDDPIMTMFQEILSQNGIPHVAFLESDSADAIQFQCSYILKRMRETGTVSVDVDSRKIYLNNEDLSIKVLPLLPLEWPSLQGEYTVLHYGNPWAKVNYTEPFQITRDLNSHYTKIGSGCMITFLEEVNITVYELTPTNPT